MDNQQARFVLQSYRPEGCDAADPHFAEALAHAERDTGMAAWLAEEQALDRAIAARLKMVRVPEGLCESILAGTDAEASPVSRNRFALLALAASIVLLCVVAGIWTLQSRSTVNFAAYRQEMVGRLDGRFQLAFTSERLSDVQQWLAENRGLTGVAVPTGLQGVPSIGCRAWTWNGRPAGLICFGLDGGKAVHLFVISREAVPAGPNGAAPQFAQVGQWQTASWSQGDVIYMLAGQMDRSALERLL